MSGDEDFRWLEFWIVYRLEIKFVLEKLEN